MDIEARVKEIEARVKEIIVEQDEGKLLIKGTEARRKATLRVKEERSKLPKSCLVNPDSEWIQVTNRSRVGVCLPCRYDNKFLY